MGELIALNLSSYQLQKMQNGGLAGPVALADQGNGTFTLVAVEQPKPSSNDRSSNVREDDKDSKPRPITQPRPIALKHDGKCARCGGQMQAGDRGTWSPDDRKVRHFTDPNDGSRCA